MASGLTAPVSARCLHAVGFRDGPRERRADPGTAVAPAPGHEGRHHMATSTRMANDGSWPRQTTTPPPKQHVTKQRAALLRLLEAQQEVLREHRRTLREAPPLESVVGADDEERAAQEFEAGLDIALLEMR